MQQPYGPVNIEGMGIILVPGDSDAERIDYANNLFNNFGVFIPVQGCTDVVTHRRSVQGNPIIALGTLQDYKCFDAIWLPELVLFDPIFSMLNGHRKDLLVFDSYLTPYLSEIYGGTIYNNNIYIPFWQWKVDVIIKWLNMENALRTLPYNLFQQILDLITTIRDRAQDICYNNPNLMIDDAIYRNARNALVAIAPNLIIASPDYVLFSIAYDNGVPDWCELYQDSVLLLAKLNVIYGG